MTTYNFVTLLKASPVFTMSLKPTGSCLKKEKKGEKMKRKNLFMIFLSWSADELVKFIIYKL